MRPWMPTAIVVGAVIGVVARRLWFAARRQTPLVLGDVDPASALGSAASVASSTSIAIVGRDLSYLVASSSWQALLAKWLRAGARIRYLVQGRDARGEALLGKLALGARGSVELLALRDDAKDSELARGYREFHFAAFESPAQLWLEGRHEAGRALAAKCEFVTAAGSDPRWAARRNEFAELASTSESIDLSGGAS